LLVFKAIPAASGNKAEWKAVLDAIGTGRVIAELDLVAIPNGSWVENTARYRIDIAAAPMSVVRGQAIVYVAAGRPGGAVVLLAFDAATMPLDPPHVLSVRAKGGDLIRTTDTFALFYAPASGAETPSYTVLPLPGTFLAVYLPEVASGAIEVASILPPSRPGPSFDASSEMALALALMVVAGAATHMFRRRET